MTKAKVSVSKKKIGRPATGVGKLIGMRWHEPALAAIDEWRRAQPDLPARGEAIRRMERALSMFIVEGIHTSIPMQQRILADPDFQAGNFDTNFIKRFMPGPK